MVDLLRGRPKAESIIGELIKAGETLFVTPHVFYELYRGVRRAPDPRAEHRLIARIGEKFRLLPFDRDAAQLAARMGDSLEDQGLDIPELDLFIASSAVVWGDGIVLTRDLRHFLRLRAFGVRALAQPP